MSQLASFFKNKVFANDNGSAILNCVSIAAIIYWLSYLDRTQSFYIAYLVTGTIAIGLVCRGERRRLHDRTSLKENVCLILLAILLAALTILGNYSLLSDAATHSSQLFYLAKPLRNFLFIISSLITYGVIAFRGYAFFLDTVVNDNNPQVRNVQNLTKARVFTFFILSWLFIAVVYLAFFFLAYYPGVLSPDSISQVNQIISGDYNNHHPFWHTQIIRLAMDLGFALFGDINAAVATFCIIQCVIMAAIFSFCVSTMFQMGLRRWILFLTLGLFAFLPYHLAYASTMWKDVLFGGVVLLFVCCFYRLRRKIGNVFVSEVLLFVSSVGVCVFRSNGLFAFLVFFIAVCIIGLRKRDGSFQANRIVCAEMGIAIVLSFIMLGPVLNGLGVKSVDRIESLSIPAQQIARVVTNERAMTDEEATVLNKAIDQDEIADAYNPHVSDPIKDLVREHEGNDAINENPWEFIKLYFSLGIKYPKDYLLAWIDQTKGYWDSGYPYWSTFSFIVDNELGLSQTPGSYMFQRIARSIGELSQDENRQSAIGIIYCTGFWVQVLICLMIFNFLSRRLEYIEPLLIICIVCTLLIATPVFAEFRYIYALYTCLPFLLSTLTLQNREISITACSEDSAGLSIDRH